ncbi:DUF3089 domain-containing protein [Leptospira stimsonii]|uniref:DUF3089 domain-containing protein n=1 Tax=Leptospira stimsonii TaxID=2202203 RepID=A0ABY2N3P4_9LEPT|nr:DUF3089 domain-containing protein [Leptospira stimsonii]TGK22829.1 DUF3089 domain-containing protein [Leptospira stimsonii]TGM15001.1 DUF3089 domain-containing protein [Leptospira stimsonii]
MRIRFLSLLSILISTFFSLSCLWIIRPSGNYSEQIRPQEPDYSLLKSWSALPQTKDDADKVPSESTLQDNQSQAPVDVFFVHPTTFYGRDWNASLEDERVNERTDESTIRQQASVFNCCAKIYAPRYRQATLYSFLDSENGKLSLELAYQDVLKSFETYLKEWNAGRPFIIASHSQGTYHAIRLLREKIDNAPLKSQLVVAYLLGGAVPIDSYKNIPICSNRTQTGCFVSWRTYGEKAEVGKLPHDLKGPYVCVNPLSWRADETIAVADLHAGGVNGKFKTIEPKLCDAKCTDGVLRISKPKAEGFSSWFGENYHVLDYGIFYQNIRNNLSERIEAFLRLKKNIN